MKKSWIAFALLLLSGAALPAAGQKFLQLEKLNSLQTRKYYPGDEITFRLDNGQWYTRVIEDVSYDLETQGRASLLLFANGHVSIDSITAFRTYNVAGWSRPIGNQMFNFAVAWLLFSAIDEAVDDNPFRDIPNSTWIIPLSSTAGGLALKRIFRHRTFRLKKDKEGNAKKWRLRVLDLNLN
ncbi:MAG: hypothetical protein RI973_2448 [Bacteroidota bacterium]|jgi:hypothetical protein